MNYFSMKNEIQDDNESVEFKNTNGSAINTRSKNTNAMIFANIDGDITYMNSEAQRLTGWSMKDAARISCNEIFKVYDLETKESLGDPVKSVIENESRIELTDNLFLESRDGANFEIEFKASPKYSEEGEMNRVILTFREIRQLDNTPNIKTDVMEKSEAGQTPEPVVESVSVSEISFNDFENGNGSHDEKNEISLDLSDSDNDQSEDTEENEVEALKLDRTSSEKQKVYTISAEDMEKPDFITS